MRTVFVAGIAVFLFIGAMSQLFGGSGLDPFCGTSAQYETTATIRYQGETLSSTVYRRNRASRAWIQTMNSSGCGETIATDFIFRSRADRIFLISSRICHEAGTSLSRRAVMDVKAICRTDRYPPRPSGYLIDNADRPASWQAFWYAGRKLPESNVVADVELVSWTARRSDKKPHDDLETIAPALLRARFESANRSVKFRPHVSTTRQQQANGNQWSPVIVREQAF